MEKVLFCMTLRYLKDRFNKHKRAGDLDTSRIYMQLNSDVLYLRWIISTHKIAG